MVHHLWYDSFDAEVDDTRPRPVAQHADSTARAIAVAARGEPWASR